MAKASRYWVTVKDVPMTQKEVRSHFGPRCGDFDKDCAVCTAWKQWDKNRKVDLLIDRPTLLGGL